MTRASRWGNPFKVEDHGRGEALRLYAEWIEHSDHPDGKWDPVVCRAQLPTLFGKDLACVCRPGDACHADILLELARTLAVLRPVRFS